MYNNYMPIFWACLCIYVGQDVGRIVDIQYREPEGQQRFVKIPKKIKFFFRFKYDTGNKVVLSAFITQILGYLFSFLEVLLLIIAIIFPSAKRFAEYSEWGIIVYAFVLLGFLTPMVIRYQTNIQIAYDCDWITFFQKAFSLLPKRKCKVVERLDGSVYVITLGKFGRKQHHARCDFPVGEGTHLYALHSEDDGFPFWILRIH